MSKEIPLARRNRSAGRKTELAGVPMKCVTITIDELTIRKLRVVGLDNVSRGVRESAALAYEIYQKAK